MDDEAYQRKRESFLIVFYLLAVGCVVFVLLFALLNWLFIQMAMVTAGIVAFASLHWILWGRSLTRSAAAADESAAPPEAPPGAPAADDDPYRGRY